MKNRISYDTIKLRIKNTGVVRDNARYMTTFPDGLMCFLSPRMLLFPIYISYFGVHLKKQITVLNALCFAFGSDLVFCLPGLFAGSPCAMLMRYQETQEAGQAYVYEMGFTFPV